MKTSSLYIKVSVILLAFILYGLICLGVNKRDTESYKISLLYSSKSNDLKGRIGYNLFIDTMENVSTYIYSYKKEVELSLIFDHVSGSISTIEGWKRSNPILLASREIRIQEKEFNVRSYLVDSPNMYGEYQILYFTENYGLLMLNATSERYELIKINNNTNLAKKIIQTIKLDSVFMNPNQELFYKNLLHKVKMENELNKIGFYQVLDSLSRRNHIKLIVSETKPVYRIHPYYVKYPKEQDKPYPPPPTSKVVYNIAFLNELIDENVLSSEESSFIFNSIDSTFSIRLNKQKLSANLITQEKLHSIFNDDSYNGWDSIENQYNCSSYSTVSTPVFNEDKSKMIITVEIECGPLCGNGYVYVFLKQSDAWIKIYSKLIWIS